MNPGVTGSHDLHPLSLDAHNWEAESRVQLEESSGRYVWVAQAGLNIDGIVHLTLDDATGRPLRAWVPSRGFRGGSFWLDSGQPEFWKEYESILGKLSSVYNSRALP